MFVADVLRCAVRAQERAARLFAVKGRTRLHAEDAALLAKARRRRCCCKACVR
jgi:hypothetical protein